MKLFTRICLILALVLFCVGTIFTIGGIAAGASLSALRNLPVRGSGHSFLETGDLSVVFPFWRDRDDGDGAESVRPYSESEDFTGEITKIVVDLRSADLHLCAAKERGGGDAADGGIRVEKEISDSRRKISLKEENGTLTIREESKTADLADLYGDAEVWIYLPEDVRLRELAVDVGEGDVELAADLYADELRISDGAGEIDFSGKIAVQTLKIEQGVGDLYAEGSLTVEKKAEIESGCGNVALEDYTGSGDADLEIGLGDLELTGELSGDFTVETGTGSIDLILRGDEDDYGYDLSCGMGELSINGRAMIAGISGEYTAGRGSRGKITLESGMGDINLEIR